MKSWNKPVIITLSSKELSDYIKVAASSMGFCHGGDFR